MKYIHYFVALTWIFSSCDPTYSIDYRIENHSSTNIKIVFEDMYRQKIDTSSIASGTEIVFYSEFNIGRSTKRYLEELKSIPANLLEIVNSNGVPFNKSELDFSLWYKYLNNNVGEVYLRVSDDDFK